MTRKKTYLLTGLAAFALIAVVVLLLMAKHLRSHFEPYIREQAILYLRHRFDSEVELAALHVEVPQASFLNLALNHGRGTVARVKGEGLVVRHRGRRDIPPMFSTKQFSFEVELGTLLDTPKVVRLVRLDGVEINIPPKAPKPYTDYQHEATEAKKDSLAAGVNIETIIVSDSNLNILVENKKKKPLHFALHRVRLQSVGVDKAMQYDAELTNPEPPGEIVSQGSFGPWVADEPGDTALDGAYKFANADLGVFKGIAGILASNGNFEGRLNSIAVRGEATVPDFRLKISGNRVPLTTRFEVLVDGTNGNTILSPVSGRLGKTSFTTSGGIIKHESDAARAIRLDVSMPRGDLQDLLRLAMKGPPFMEGVIALKTRIDIPPLNRKVKEKLRLDGNFELLQGKFLRSSIQSKIDMLSRRGRGQPDNEKIDEVAYQMKGQFRLENEVIYFNSLSFGVPGANVDLSGSYNLRADLLDFHGALKLQARVSQTMTGWKKWVLKPIDPVFSKNGAGTFLRIKIDGKASDPQFGLDYGHSKKKH